MWTHRVPQYNADRLEVLFCLTTHCLGPSRSRVSAERPFTLEWSRTSQEVTLMWCQWTRRGIIAAAIRMASPQKGNISCKRGILLCVFDWHVERCFVLKVHAFHVTCPFCFSSSSLTNPTGGKAFRVFAVIWKPLKRQSTLKSSFIHFKSSKPTYYQFTTYNYVHSYSEHISVTDTVTKSVTQGFASIFGHDWITVQ